MNKFLEKFFDFFPAWFFWTVFFLSMHYLAIYLLGIWNMQLSVLLDVVFSLVSLFVVIFVQVLWEAYILKKVEDKEKMRIAQNKVVEEIHEIKTKVDTLTDPNLPKKDEHL